MESRLKIGRAGQHVATLRGEVAAYRARIPVYAVTFPNLRDPRYICWAIYFDEPVPPHWAPIIGDIIHNLRSSLDLLACEIVRLNKGDPKDVHFPFAKDATELETMIKNRKIDRADPGAVDLIRALKPYRGGNKALRGVHDLDIVDKHQALLPVMGMITTPGGGGIAPGDLSKKQIPTMGTMLRAHAPEAKFGKSPAPFDLMFSHGGPFAGSQLIPTLEKLIEEFSGIVDTFEAYCLGTLGNVPPEVDRLMKSDPTNPQFI